MKKTLAKFSSFSGLVGALLCGLIFGNAPVSTEAATIIVNLAQKVKVVTGDVVKLKDHSLTVEIGANAGSKCAVPGFNCGSGYQPPRPTFKLLCGPEIQCAFVMMTEIKDGTSAILSIEDETSCLKNDPEHCFRQFAQQSSNDDRCMKLKSPIGKYYCLEYFTSSIRPENKSLCDLLPSDIYALKWNCYYQYAIRYRDPSFCDKYSRSEVSGRDRCLLKMASLLNDKGHCQKISDSKDHSYREQCQQLQH